MDLENFKNIWSEEKISEIPEITLQQQKELRNPIEIVKKNMKFEFWSTLPIFPLLIWYLYTQLDTGKLMVYSISLVIVGFLICIFYIFKLRKFYKDISTLSFNSFQHVLELQYHMKYYRDVYQSYFIAYSPILLCEFFIVLEITGKHQANNVVETSLILVIGLFISFILAFGAWKLWYEYFYGKHFRTIQKVMQQLKTDSIE